MWFNLIKAKSGKQTYKVLVETEDDLPIITISDVDVSYICKITDENVKRFADVFQISVPDYLEKLNNLLQCCDSCVDIKDYIVYIYKDGKIKYFSQKAETTNHLMIMNKYVNYLHGKTTALNEQNVKLEQEKEGLKSDLELANSKLDAIIDKQADHEESLYTCFVSLLNEKKRRIQYLRNFVNADNSEKETKTNKRKLETISESQSSDDYNTDDEGVQPTKTTSNVDNNKQLNTLPMRLSDTDEFDTYLLNYDTDIEFPHLLSSRQEVRTKRMKTILSSEPTTSKAHQVVIPEPDLDKTPENDNNTQIITVSTQDLINDI